MIILTIFKVVGCLFLLIVCVPLAFFYLREGYARRQGEKELSMCLEKCDTIQGEILRITNEINETVSQRRELPVEDEYQEYRVRLGNGVPDADEYIDILALIWFVHNHNVMEWELCPDWCKRRDELQKRLRFEEERVALLKWMGKSCIMSNYNYALWRRYRNIKQQTS